MSPSNRPIVICGAGPVGLLLGNLLGKAGLSVVILEQRLERPTTSMAIGITPPSLKILEQLDLTETFLTRGLAVQDSSVFERSRHVGDLSFASLNTDYPFILSLPQSETIEILETHLQHYDNVTLRRGVRLDEVRQHASHVELSVCDTTRNARETLCAERLIGCDGAHSQVRQQAGIGVRQRPYAQHFLMADFVDQSDFGQRACLYFTPQGSVESFPLPGDRRRWIVQLDGLPENQQDQPNLVEQLVKERCSQILSSESKQFQSHFNVQRMLARHYFHKRVVLCGDAAHAMSPVGGQGMNTGFADATLLSQTLVQILSKELSSDALLRHYERQRKRAYRVAALRAACNMWVGTWRGAFWSKLRHLLLHVLLRKPQALCLAEHFAMLTIPRKLSVPLPV
ncbi:MAG: FAD-dependent monooxygenase [Phycisphaeraceae bacterium]|nr:FAD-dependent monooxygenase [Phycisphaeraceae bacterium]